MVCFHFAGDCSQLVQNFCTFSARRSSSRGDERAGIVVEEFEVDVVDDDVVDDDDDPNAAAALAPTSIGGDIVCWQKTKTDFVESGTTTNFIVRWEVVVVVVVDE